MHTRGIVMAGAVVAGIFWIGLLTLLLPECPVDAEGRQINPQSSACADREMADLLLDRNTQIFAYPLTIQNVMWIVFFVAAGELMVRHMAGTSEEDQLRMGLLPEDAKTILRQQDIGTLYSRVRESDPERHYWLQRLLSGAMLQFQSSGSVDQVNAVFNTSMELYQHETELRYNVLRYLVWLIPTLGFVGTVLGIAAALATAGGMLATDDDLAGAGPQMMTRLTAELGVAFYTTLLALLQSAGLMLGLHVVQGREEGALNRVGHYCLKNLVNRLYERRR